MPPVSKETFVKLLQLSSTDVAMATHDGYYVQKDGLAMGSPPAPQLAIIWLANKEAQIKDDAKLFERYMDDIIRTIKAEDIDKKLTEINNLHPNLKFTIEREKDGKIPFLDMLLIRKENCVESTWYCKPSDTGLVMNFQALAPKRYKKGVVSGFVHRIYRACSTWENFHTSLNKAKEILEKNQYPPPFYEDVIAKTLEKIVVPQEHNEQINGNEEDTSGQKRYVVTMQFRGATTEQFVRKLKACGAPIQVILTLRKLRSCLPSLKAPVEKLMKSDVVYKITCSRCKTCYVGKTSRHLATRFAEHRTHSDGPVVQHMKECKIGVGELEVDVLKCVMKGGFQLSIMEALFIRELKPALNTRDEYRDHELTIKI